RSHRSSTALVRGNITTTLCCRSAVVRELEMIGEALNQLTKLAPEWGEAIPHCREAIGLRNILIHGYTVIDEAMVSLTVDRDLPTLREQVDTLLRSQNESGG
ncbi:MAG: HepT-like ribonuclease domain-containing protein, partial [Halofilum sp. (in: g-proteobacteria)]